MSDNGELDQTGDSWKHDHMRNGCPYTPNPEFVHGGSFWKNLKRVVSQTENRQDIPLLRIREWNGKALLNHRGKTSEDVERYLEEIADQRQEKAQNQSWDGKVKWIHVPGNDMGACLRVLMSLCHIAKPQLELLLCKLHWWDQLNVPWDMLPWEDGSPDTAPTNGSDTDETQESYKSGSQSQTSGEMVDSWEHKPVEALFMDAAAFHVDFEIQKKCGCWRRLSQSTKAREDSSKEVLHVIEDLIAGQKGLDRGNRRASENNEIRAKKSSTLSSTVLYMPYLHYDSLKKHMDELEERQKYPSDWAHHPRRSLDEAADRFFTYRSLAERNNDQVVTRYLRNPRNRNALGGKEPVGGPTLMVVDQLWLWILDKDTLVTCFPGDKCKEAHNKCKEAHKKCPKLNLECLVMDQIRRKCCDGRLDAERLASHLIYRSYSIFTHRHLRDPTLRFIEIFEKSISEQRANSTDLFRALEVKKKSGSLFSRRSPDSHKDQDIDGTCPEGDATRKSRRRRRKDVFNLQEDIEAVGQVRDIDEELHIMMRIVELQMSALERTGLPKWEENWKEDLEKFKGRLEGLSAQTKDINGLLVQTLGLKQAQLSVRQNEIVLLFTVVTIVFLPLGFMSSIFGMNAAELSDGSPVGLRRIFTYMFPIGVFVSVVALAWAFEPDIADGISILKALWHGWRKDKGKEHEGKKSAWSFGRKRKGSRKEDPYP